MAWTPRQLPLQWTSDVRLWTRYVAGMGREAKGIDGRILELMLQKQSWRCGDYSSRLRGTSGEYGNESSDSVKSRAFD
jgi:hypothetical protein